MFLQPLESLRGKPESYAMALATFLLMSQVWFPFTEWLILSGCFGSHVWDAGLRIVESKPKVILSNGNPLQGDPLGWYWISFFMAPPVCFFFGRCLAEALWRYRHPLRNHVPGYSKRRDLP